MIYPERMERMAIVGPSEHQKKVIEVLHKFAIVHIVDHRKNEIDVGRPLDESAHISELLIKVRALIHALSIEDDEEPRPVPEGDLDEQIIKIQDAVRQNSTERENLQKRIEVLKQTPPGPVQEKNLSSALRSLDANQSAKQRLGEESKEFLLGVEPFLAGESRKAQAPLRFAKSATAFMITGWAPIKQMQPLTKALEEATNGEIHLEVTPTKEEPPIKLDNHEIVSPYEVLLRMYTLPKYSEIDPSFFIFLSFPIFFGFILGDMGYGLVILLAALGVRWLKRHNKTIKAFTTILITSALSTIAFGFLYGEMFGAEHLGPIELHPILHRTHDITALLLISLAVGVAHITLALTVGFVQEARHHGGWKAFCAKLSWLVLILGAGLIALDIMLGYPTKTIGYVLVALAIILIFIAEGAHGLIELPAIFSNIASYARLMAVGVASAGLAIVTNELARDLFLAGGFASILLGIVVLLFGHIINIALGILGSFIHGLRLNYVEFFGKFYKGGGKPYRPFGGENS